MQIATPVLTNAKEVMFQKLTAEGYTKIVQEKKTHNCKIHSESITKKHKPEENANRSRLSKTEDLILLIGHCPGQKGIEIEAKETTYGKGAKLTPSEKMFSA